MVMTETDWEYMLETALLHNMLWNPVPQNPATTGGRARNGAVSATQLAAEIRQRVQKFGATFEDRLKLRMSIQTPQSEQEFNEEVADLAATIDYTSLINKYTNAQSQED